MTDVDMVRAPRLLLINPKFKESFWSFRWALDEVLDGKSAVNPPLGLATIAALTPKHWDIRIVDENVEPIPLDPDVDIVGICGTAYSNSLRNGLADQCPWTSLGAMHRTYIGS